MSSFSQPATFTVSDIPRRASNGNKNRSSRNLPLAERIAMRSSTRTQSNSNNNSNSNQSSSGAAVSSPPCPSTSHSFVLRAPSPMNSVAEIYELLPLQTSTTRPFPERTRNWLHTCLRQLTHESPDSDNRDQADEKKADSNNANNALLAPSPGLVLEIAPVFDLKTDLKINRSNYQQANFVALMNVILAACVKFEFQSPAFIRYISDERVQRFRTAMFEKFKHSWNRGAMHSFCTNTAEDAFSTLFNSPTFVLEHWQEFESMTSASASASGTTTTAAAAAVHKRDLDGMTAYQTLYRDTAHVSVHPIGNLTSFDADCRKQVSTAMQSALRLVRTNQKQLALSVFYSLDFSARDQFAWCYVVKTGMHSSAMPRLEVEPQLPTNEKNSASHVHFAEQQRSQLSQSNDNHDVLIVDHAASSNREERQDEHNREAHAEQNEAMEVDRRETQATQATQQNDELLLSMSAFDKTQHTQTQSVMPDANVALTLLDEEEDEGNTNNNNTNHHNHNHNIASAMLAQTAVINEEEEEDEDNDEDVVEQHAGNLAHTHSNTQFDSAVAIDCSHGAPPQSARQTQSDKNALHQHQHENGEEEETDPLHLNMSVVSAVSPMPSCDTAVQLRLHEDSTVEEDPSLSDTDDDGDGDDDAVPAAIVQPTLPETVAQNDDDDDDDDAVFDLHLTLDDNADVNTSNSSALQRSNGVVMSLQVTQLDEGERHDDEDDDRHNHNHNGHHHHPLPQKQPSLPTSLSQEMEDVEEQLSQILSNHNEQPQQQQLQNVAGDHSSLHLALSALSPPSPEHENKEEKQNIGNVDADGGDETENATDSEHEHEHEPGAEQKKIDTTTAADADADAEVGDPIVIQLRSLTFDDGLIHFIMSENPNEKRVEILAYLCTENMAYYASQKQPKRSNGKIAKNKKKVAVRVRPKKQPRKRNALQEPKEEDEEQWLPSGDDDDGMKRRSKKRKHGLSKDEGDGDSADEDQPALKRRKLSPSTQIQTRSMRKRKSQENARKMYSSSSSGNEENPDEEGDYQVEEEEEDSDEEYDFESENRNAQSQTRSAKRKQKQPKPKQLQKRKKIQIAES